MKNSGHVKIIRRTVIAWSFAIGIAVAAVPAGAVPPGGGELPSFPIPEGTDDIFRFATEAGRDAPNPHVGIPCTTCHEEVPVAGAAFSDVLAGLKRRPYALCGTCHPDYVNIHPTGSAPSMTTPPELPLDAEGNLTCTTCHAIHLPSARHSLLRGFGTEEGNRYTVRRELCLDCHGEQYRLLNPHRSRGRKEMCIYCHLEVPATDADVADVRFRVNVITMCNFCHGVQGNFHPLNVNPELNVPPSLPRGVKGSVHCGTCHNPHGVETATRYLRTGYVHAVQEETSSIAHGADVDCSKCHTMSAGGGGGAGPLLFGGDVVVLCNSCHGVTPDPHPVNVSIPGTMGHPRDLPLTGEHKITCLSCHDVDCSDNQGSRKSIVSTRLFDRSRGDNTLCFRCHVKKKWSGFTPHVEIDRRKEEYDKQHCLFCHDIDPSWSGDTRFTVSVAVPAKMMCLLCHPERDHPAGVDHGVRPVVANVPKDFPLDRDGFVNCITCHDVHRANPTARRREVDDTLCQRCHAK